MPDRHTIIENTFTRWYRGLCKPDTSLSDEGRWVYITKEQAEAFRLSMLHAEYVLEPEVTKLAWEIKRSFDAGRLHA